jgi:hypothetical protein
MPAPLPIVSSMCLTDARRPAARRAWRPHPRRGPDRGPSGARSGSSGAVNPGAVAFRNLTQWEPVAASERRENLVTDSALDDPRRVGVQSYRELSGFQVTVGAQRRALATLAKTLMPLLLMTLIMFASLYFRTRWSRRRSPSPLPVFDCPWGDHRDAGGRGSGRPLGYIDSGLLVLLVLDVTLCIAAKRRAVSHSG